MDELLNIDIPRTEGMSIEQMPFLNKDDNPLDENNDWFHMYCKITDEVYIGYPEHSDPKYIIGCHKPSGLRIKVRFGGSVTVAEQLAHVPRSIIDKSY